MMDLACNKEFSLFNIIENVKEEMNHQQRYSGMQRLQRPPVFCWAQRQPKEIEIGPERHENNEEGRKILMDGRSSDGNFESDISYLLRDFKAEMEVKSPDAIRIFACTYNMQGGVFDCQETIDKMFQKDNVDHDIYFLGT